MLLAEHFRQIDELSRLLESREEIILFPLLVIVLDECLNDLRRRLERRGRQVAIAAVPPDRFAVNQQHAIQQAVLAHEIFGWRNILGLLLSGSAANAVAPATKRPAPVIVACKKWRWFSSYDMATLLGCGSRP